MQILSKIFGTKHNRDIKQIQPLIDEVNRLCELNANISDKALKGKTTEFRNQLRMATKDVCERQVSLRNELNLIGGNEGREGILDEIEEIELEIKKIELSVLDEILPEVFSVFKEVCKRFKAAKIRWDRAGEEITWDMVPYDVQIVGAVVLHQGKIAEMATGEGKTLVAGLALYLNGLTGRGVHLVTVNTYLAKRDAMWLGPIYITLGLTVGIIQDRSMGVEAYLLEEDGQGGFRLRECEHKDAYEADIVYGTKDQFGFDYLYDNMSVHPEDLMQRGYYFSIIDEADSILIDEARTPLIISGPVPEADSTRYVEMRPLVEKLVRRQTDEVNAILTEAEKDLEGETEYEVGILLLKVQRGMPKNRRFMKRQQEEGIKQLIGRVEADYIRDKRTPELDEGLFFSIDEKAHVISLTEKGRQEISRSPDDFVLPDLDDMLQALDVDVTISSMEKAKQQDQVYQNYSRKSEEIHSLQQLLKAYTLFEKDVHYMVADSRVIIVDEFTGRPQPGRRFSDGLHQALEAKERVKVERDTQTVATITLQNYFRLYDRLAGMTGTAETESAELFQIYKLDVVVIPTNEPVRRIDSEDLIFRTKREKYNAIVNEVARLHQNKLPVLVGTITVEVSELLSRMLKRKGIKHTVLNARYHQQEAQIVTQAGQPGVVTIATNMAGRGTDIKLGPGVVKAPEGHCCALVANQEDPRPICPYLEEYGCLEDVPCGLHIVGTGRHEARRIDRQLRGRAGRQGDPGNSRFFISLEDDLMRLFGSERIARIMDRLGAEEGEVIEHRMVTRSIERAQKRVEARNFEIRKHLLEYDDVMNQQREVIYDRRRYALEENEILVQVGEVLEETVESILELHMPPESHREDWNLEGLSQDLRNIFLQTLDLTDDSPSNLDRGGLRGQILDKVWKSHHRREHLIGSERFRQIERMVTLGVIDEKWKEHLREMDDLKEGIGLRGYGQKDPLVEYKREGFQMFVDLLEDINRETLKTLFSIPIEEVPIQRQRKPEQLALVHQDAAGMGFTGSAELGMETNSTEEVNTKSRPVRVQKKIGRNDLCSCGSQKKYKKCCGRGI